MTDVKLMVLYPQPVDPMQFDEDYRDHLALLHQMMSIPEDQRPYSVTRFQPTPEGQPPFYQLFTMRFSSEGELQKVMNTEEMQKVAADAIRISTGGAPVVLVGKESP